MDLDRLEAMLRRMEAIASENDERWMEAEAMLSAQRFVLEQLLANAFLGRLAAFDAFTTELLEATRTSSTTSGPMHADERVERQARIATHVARLSASVRQRVQKDAEG